MSIIDVQKIHARARGDDQGEASLIHANRNIRVASVSPKSISMTYELAFQSDENLTYVNNTYFSWSHNLT